MSTKSHDSTTCTAGVGGAKCEMCQFAGEFEKNRSKSPSEASSTENQSIEQGAAEPKNAPQVKYGPGIDISAPDFAREWDTAPRWATRTTEMEAAEWWLLRGRQLERQALLATQNADLQEILRVARERISR